MVSCPACGLPGADGARFCSRCGHELEAAQAAARRRLVTILFCDLVDSTKLGERLDPEVLRTVQERYFAAGASTLTRHGGQVEKFIGDAVMCVFGLPRAHEDDALRACRAALELADAVGRLSAELSETLGVVLRVRIGVHSGEVVAGDPSRGQALATGDAVNTAARLEQAAASGGVLVGALTRRLAGDALVTELVPPVLAKGKAEPVEAYRLVGVREGGGGVTAGFAGRGDELARLRAALAAAAAGDGVALTVLGEAGIGKSRLVTELLEREGAVTALRGRCLSYGEGIAFWPLREMLESLAGDGGAAALRERLARDPDPDGLTARLERLAGLAEGAISAADGADAVRRLIVALAAAGPLAVVVEDVHWAEPALLDLLQPLVAAPPEHALLLLTARPELTGRRPRLSEAALVLGPLDRATAAALVAQVPAARREAMLDAAEGNPLFLEQLAADGDVDGRLPASLRALLSARIDALPEPRREVLEAAAVCGREFFTVPLARLAGGRPDELVVHLAALSAAGLVAPGRAEGIRSAGMTGLFGDERHAFRHALVRDAVLAGLPKARAAELHEAFAGLLEDEPDAPRPIVAWHLERAAALRLELDPHAAGPLAQRAAEALEAAGQGALARDDAVAADGLLSRAAELAEVAQAATVGDAASRALEAGATIGGYEITAIAGRGGMGIVYRARDTTLGREVALKVIAPELAREPGFAHRFRRESRLAARIEHPNVVPVFAAGEDGGRLYIAMRFVEGSDLGRLVARQGRLAPAEAADVVAQVAGALDAAHAAGLVHRDVKPANVLLVERDGERHAYLTDFGLTIEGNRAGGLTRTGQWVGTVAYVAPEQIRGERVDARTDVYALGGVLHHCLTGSPPFPRRHELDALAAHLSEPPPRPSATVPGIPTAFDSVVAAALAKSPGDRFASAGALGDAARGAAEGRAATLPRVRRTRPGWHRGRVIGAVAVAGLAAAATAVALTTSGGTPSRSPSAPAAVRPIAVAARPDDIAVVAGLVWTQTRATGQLVRVDPATRRTRRFFPPVDLGGGTAVRFAAGAGSLWSGQQRVNTGGVTRIDPRDGSAQARVPIADGVAALGFGEGAVWVASVHGTGTGRLVRIDPSTNRREPGAGARIGRDPTAVAAGAGAVWVADGKQGVVRRIDARTRAVSEIAVGRGPVAVTAGTEGVWVLDRTDRTLVRIDPDTSQVAGAPVSLGKDLADIVLSGGDLWVAGGDGTVTRVEPRTGRVRGAAVPAGAAPLALAADGAAVWVASTTDRSVRRISPG